MTRSKIQLIKTDRTWSTISSLIRSFHISLSCFLTKISNKQNMSNKHINLGSSWQWTGCGLESVPWSVLTPILISCTIFKSIIMWVNMSLDFTLPSFFRLHPFGSIYNFTPNKCLKSYLTKIKLTFTQTVLKKKNKIQKDKNNPTHAEIEPVCHRAREVQQPGRFPHNSGLWSSQSQTHATFPSLGSRQLHSPALLQTDWSTAAAMLTTHKTAHLR